MAAVREPEISPLTRHLLHAFLLVFAVTGIARLELYPFSGFRLFSELRGETRTSWQLRGVDAEGEEVGISLGHLPLGYRQTARLIPGMADMSVSERDEICDAWAGPLRDRGVDVVGVRIYRTVGSVRPDGPPPERTLVYECGGGAMNAVVERLDRWLFAPEPAGRVRAMRAAIAGLLMFRLATGPYGDLAGQPAALFRPVLLLSWLDQMPSFGVLVGLQVVGFVAAGLAILGWRERGTFLVGWSSLLVLDGCWASRGKIQHNDLPLLLVAAVLAAAPVGVRWTDERRGAVWGWPVRTSVVVVTGIYFLTGFQKVVASGPAWVLSDNLRNVMYGAALTGKAPTDEVSQFIADRPVLAQTVALITITVELGAVVALVWPRTRIAYVAAITLLHLGVYVTHGLDYSMWIGTAAIVLIDWRPALLRRAPRRATAAAVP